MSHLIDNFRLSARNNRYANAMLATACAELGEAGVWAPGVNFFPSIGETLNHILLIDLYYLDMMEEEGHGLSVIDEFEPFRDPAGLACRQEAQDIRLIRFCDALTEADLARTVLADRRAGKVPERMDRLLPHLFMHDVHHRGQIHAMLAGTSVKPPQLDDFWLDDRRAPEAEAALAMTGAAKVHHA